MKFRVRTWRRSLLLTVLVTLLLMTPRALGAIAPEFYAQLTQNSPHPWIEQLLGGIPIPSSGLNPDEHLPSIRTVLPQPVNVPNPVAGDSFIPRQQIVAVASSNYEPRMTTDIDGNPIANEMIAVLHETVGSASSAINTFQNYYENEADQRSYHALIGVDGTIYYLVPPEMRAFGAGNSVFDGPNGSETVRLHPVFPPSVNNFAYHASLETPSDGRGNSAGHSGYTEAQYRSLAWLIAQTNIPDERITTHRAVDRSGSRRDPRSFDQQRFLTQLHAFREAIAGKS